MNLRVIGIFLIAVALLAVPAGAQLTGDLNCNGYPFEISDYIFAILILIDGCDAFILECTAANGDMDGDGLPLTLGDLLPAAFIIDGNLDWPDFPRHPNSDTIVVESIVTHPGETIALPLWIKTMDTLMAVQFLLELDPDYLEFDTIVVHNDFPLTQQNCHGNVYCVTNQDLHFPIVLLPGDHHIGDVILNVNPDINQPVTTGLFFSSAPALALYTGFANSDFFLPVLVDAEIEIVPLTNVESTDEIIPSEFEISAYPNPFNDVLNISVISDHSTGITIYDILGRPVKSFAINAGNNLVRWDATDESGRSLSGGVYFIGNSENRRFEKVLYLK